jgi:hypothetical protein
MVQLPSWSNPRLTIRRRFVAAVGSDSPKLAPLGTTEADAAMSVGYQPGDGTLHQRAEPSVLLAELTTVPRRSQGDEFFVIGSELELAALFGGGAAGM